MKLLLRWLSASLFFVSLQLVGVGPIFAATGDEI
jgi:hypothetical protein